MPEETEHVDSQVEGQASGHDVMGSELTGEEMPTAAAAPPPGRMQKWRRPLLIAAPVVVAIGAILFYLNTGRYQTTDNAYVETPRVSISANVSGRVVEVAVHENQRVKKGDMLFRLDPAPFRTAVQEAQAALASARLSVTGIKANYAEGESELRAARERLNYAHKEAARQKALLAEGISSQAQYDAAALAEITARQQIQTIGQRNASVLASLAGRADVPPDQHPTVMRAAAALDRAQLNLGYTVIRAPQDGIVTKVEQLQVGDYVNAAAPVFSLSGNRIWIEANFKENQLTHMRPGQSATVTIDAYPDLELKAHVASFSPGTGSSFSLLPAENATGNWVKVVQRLPVRLSLDKVPEGALLHAGLSADVSVDTRHRRHLFGGGAADAQTAQPGN